MRDIVLSVVAFLLCATSAQAQGAAKSKLACPSEIPAGVKIIRLPATDHSKVTVSDFKLAMTKDSAGYDLTMRIKNGTDNWCITSFGFTFSLGDARGQEWVANEYPAVKRFTMKLDLPEPVNGQKSAPSSATHGVGLNPGQDETRVLFNIYDYIQPRPSGTFDGFHIISGEVKFCLGYILDTPK
jgi:hypothetical protein